MRSAGRKKYSQIIVFLKCEKCRKKEIFTDNNFFLSVRSAVVTIYMKQYLQFAENLLEATFSKFVNISK